MLRLWINSTLTNKLKMGSTWRKKLVPSIILSLYFNSVYNLSQLRNGKHIVVMVKQTSSMSCVIHRPHTGVQRQSETINYLHKTYNKVRSIRKLHVQYCTEWSLCKICKKSCEVYAVVHNIGCTEFTKFKCCEKFCNAKYMYVT